MIENNHVDKCLTKILGRWTYLVRRSIFYDRKAHHVHGILVQFPLPDQIDEQAVLDKIDPTKDVDGFHVYNAGRLATGSDGLVPCTPLGCIMMIKDRLGEDLSGKQALVIDRSNIVGKPMAALLLKEHCTVTIAHSRTQDLASEARRADILVN